MIFLTLFFFKVIIRYLEKQTVKPIDCKMLQSWMAFNLLATQELLLVVCLFGWFWFEIWIQLSLFNFFASGWKKTKTNQNGWEIASFMINWIIAGFTWCHQKFTLENFQCSWVFLSWSIRAAENEYSNKFLLRKGSSLFCDHSELEFLSFCVMRHSWRPRQLSRE